MIKLSCFPRITILLLAIVVISLSCSSSKELTRSHALTLIKASKEYTEPATMSLKGNGDIPVQAKSENDSESAAQAQAIEAFLGDYPERAVLQYLGLIEIKATTLKRPVAIKPPEFPVKRPDGTTTTVSPRLPTKFEPWVFRVEAVLTDKGKQAANEAPGGNGQAIPIAWREIIEVIGITSTQAGQAQAEFTWKMVPNKVGEAFDPTSAAFNALPENLQRAVRDPHGMFPSMAAKNFDGVNRSVGIFRRYDDGWRLVAIQ